MPRFFSLVGPHVYHAGRPVATLDTDRMAYAHVLTQRDGWSPLRAHLVAVRGWHSAIARAYALLGADGGIILTRDEARAAGREHGLLQ